MYYKILENYWKEFHQNKGKDIKEIYKNLEKKERILFVSVFIFVLIGIISATVWLFEKSRNPVTVGVMIGALAGEYISALIFTKNIKQKSITETIFKMKCKYTEVHEWLNQLGYTKKAEIRQLTYRCECMLDEWERTDKKNENRFEKIVSLFYVPALLAIVSWILASNKDMQNMKQYIIFVVLLVTLGALFYLLLICIAVFIENSEYTDKKKLIVMIKDFQGVLDYCFECTDEDIQFYYLKNDGHTL